MNPIDAVWTFPSIILAAILIAWAAECGQFYISQGLALAVLAWVQTLPEFAVEAAIALEAAKDPVKVHLVTANFTGSLRLFVGLGWPMVYFVFFLFKKRGPGESFLGTIKMDDEHSVATVSLVPALVYFLFIYFKGTLTIVDGIVLILIYCFYLWFLSKMPPQDEESIEDLGVIPRKIMNMKPPASYASIAGLFVVGALILWFVAHPFLESMLAVALAVGVSQFVFVQWVAPFLSEFPEKLSAFHWARSQRAPMALSNFVSSSINQWTVLVGIVPFVYSFGLGSVGVIHFDPHQKAEILLTIMQSYLGFLFLLSMDFTLFEAVGLFVLWIVQFFIPSIRGPITWVYFGWAMLETARLLIRRERNAFVVFRELFRKHLLKSV